MYPTLNFRLYDFFKIIHDSIYNMTENSYLQCNLLIICLVLMRIFGWSISGFAHFSQVSTDITWSCLLSSFLDFFELKYSWFPILC